MDVKDLIQVHDGVAEDAVDALREDVLWFYGLANDKLYGADRDFDLHHHFAGQMHRAADMYVSLTGHDLREDLT